MLRNPKSLGSANLRPTALRHWTGTHDATSLKNKLASITGFKGITSPMKKDEKGWYPDFLSRYFTEDFGYSQNIYGSWGKNITSICRTLIKSINGGKQKIAVIV